MPLPFALLAITGPERVTTDGAVRRAAAVGGPRVAILLRDPQLSPGALRSWAERLIPSCRAEGARILVHGDAAIARQVGADGVHLPERGSEPREARALLPTSIVGVSRHDGDGLERSRGADYATLSPVFTTPGKGIPLGLGYFSELCGRATLPVVALGGVTPELAGPCRAAGAAAVAAIRAVWEGDQSENVRALLAGWDAV